MLNYKNGNVPIFIAELSVATIIDVAKAAGVSKSTVSRAFTDPGAVKPQTFERIKRTIKTLNYTPNALARAMITKKTETFAFIINKEQFPVITNPFYGQILESVVERAGQKGYSLYISSTGAVGGHSLDALLQKQIDGVIFASYTEGALLRSFLERGIPVVLVNSRADIPGVCSILSDDRGGIARAVEHLARGGRNHIGLIEGKFTRFIVERRHEAFMRAVKKFGMHTAACNIAMTNAAIPDAYGAALAMLRAKNPPEALVCTNDVIAVGAVKAAHKLGLSVPRDIAVTGYDNSDLCAACEPALTSVDANTAEMGKAAVDALFKQLSGEPVARAVPPVQTRLVVRESA